MINSGQREKTENFDSQADILYGLTLTMKIKLTSVDNLLSIRGVSCFGRRHSVAGFPSGLETSSFSCFSKKAAFPC